MDQFPAGLSAGDIERAKEGVSGLTQEYIARLEWIARRATHYYECTTAFTPAAYEASGNLSAALSRVVLVPPERTWHEYVTSGRASKDVSS